MSRLLQTNNSSVFMVLLDEFCSRTRWPSRFELVGWLVGRCVVATYAIISHETYYTATDDEFKSHIGNRCCSEWKWKRTDFVDLPRDTLDIRVTKESERIENEKFGKLSTSGNVRIFELCDTHISRLSLRLVGLVLCWAKNRFIWKTRCGNFFVSVLLQNIYKNKIIQRN